ncbi:signal recognition particle-docking protein FtsY [Malacoplasma iowae 695]|nr:signal recognition particle-docking protein FtsY [Malacoplasma iowae 695]
MKIVDAIRDEINFQNVKDPKLIKEIIVDKIFTYYIQDTNVNTFLNVKNDRTNVILVTGVNGVGKTTSIAKIANKFKKEKKKILLVAGDTFRAGAVEQLNVWSQKIGTDIVLPDKPNQDPASVIYMGLKKGYEEKYDLIICDTSGRLQNKVNLMNELKKIHQVIHKFDNSAPHEVLLVLDATTGQSGIIQAKAFKEITDVTGIILAKMDSTSKGGIILSIKDNFDIPVKYIGLGEKLEDLSPFDLEKFIIGITKELKI